MQTTYLDFELPLEELDKQVSTLSQVETRSAQQQTELATQVPNLSLIHI